MSEIVIVEVETSFQPTNAPRRRAMTRIEAGDRVKKGYYFSAKNWTLHPMPKDGEALPGEAGERYVHVPLLLAFAVAPLMGAAFLMFLPFVGFYLALSAALRPVVNVFRRSAEEVAATVQPGWAPGEAHLTGRRAEGEGAGEKGPSTADGRLESLSKEIGERREEQKKA
jgi:hypothetical protein